MNIKQSPQQAKSLSEVCGEDPQAFQRFLLEKNRVLQQMEQESNERVRQALAQRLAWAA
ncbi:MAG: hypothetical protein PHD76_13940 [Methylacidiphilales bacterium]|nr:hypothetical protein [Candidatus Methylacidiphilales bacterium]